MNPQFLHDVLAVMVDSFDGPLQFAGNPFVARALGDQPENLQFAGRQQLGSIIQPAPCSRGSAHEAHGQRVAG